MFFSSCENWCPIVFHINDYRLSKKEIAELEALHRSLRDKRQADCVKTVIALARGWSAAQIAEIFFLDEKTSRYYFQRYRQGGLQALLEDHRPGAEPKLDDHQLWDLSAYLEANILPNARAVIPVIEQRYGVSYSVNGVTDLLHRLGFSYKKPTHVPSKQNPADQQAFLEAYEHLKRKTLWRSGIGGSREPSREQDIELSFAYSFSFRVPVLL